MAHEDASPADSLYVRPVLDEFKAFVQHKIEVLERFKNVEELRVYLDALELGLNTIQDIQIEAKEDVQITEVEFEGGPEGGEPSEESGVETEELEGGDEAGEEEFALVNAGEVLMGEKEDARAGDPDVPGETEETLRPSDAEEDKPYLDVGEEGGDAESDTKDPGDGEVDGVLATRFVKISEEDGDEGEEGAPPVRPGPQEGGGPEESEGEGGIEVEIPDDEIR